MIRVIRRICIGILLIGVTARPEVQTPTKAIANRGEQFLKEWNHLFKGGPESLVARAVGHAEGTRTANGGKTRAFYGHTDLGNGVWNLGSFSFQHCRDAAYKCSTPEQADKFQLKRLWGQAVKLQEDAKKQGLTLTTEEALNGIDLANQAPLAALAAQGGYIELLKKAKSDGKKGDAAILWARVNSYWDGKRKKWAASGLGNTEARITHDQKRRMDSITDAVAEYRQQQQQN
jgi:hypothetical protein